MVEVSGNIAIPGEVVTQFPERAQTGRCLTGEVLIGTLSGNSCLRYGMISRWPGWMKSESGPITARFAK